MSSGVMTWGNRARTVIPTVNAISAHARKARVQPLVERGLAWQDNVSNTPEFLKLRQGDPRDLPKLW